MARLKASFHRRHFWAENTVFRQAKEPINDMTLISEIAIVNSKRYSWLVVPGGVFAEEVNGSIPNHAWDDTTL